MMHPAIREELDMLRERYPDKTELTLDDYADYFHIARGYASQHFSRLNKRERIKIAHKRIGRKIIIIPMIDFAYWLASKKVVDGMPLVMPSSDDLKQDMKNRRGFSSAPKYNYRRLG